MIKANEAMEMAKRREEIRRTKAVPAGERSLECFHKAFRDNGIQVFDEEAKKACEAYLEAVIRNYAWNHGCYDVPIEGFRYITDTEKENRDFREWLFDIVQENGYRLWGRPDDGFMGLHISWDNDRDLCNNVDLIADRGKWGSGTRQCFLDCTEECGDCIYHF